MRRSGQPKAHCDSVAVPLPIESKVALWFTACPLWVKSGHFGLRQGCPLYPQERTFSEAAQMSAKCQKRTLADRAKQVGY